MVEVSLAILRGDTEDTKGNNARRFALRALEEYSDIEIPEDEFDEWVKEGTVPFKSLFASRLSGCEIGATLEACQTDFEVYSERLKAMANFIQGAAAAAGSTQFKETELSGYHFFTADDFPRTNSVGKCVGTKNPDPIKVGVHWSEKSDSNTPPLLPKQGHVARTPP